MGRVRKPISGGHKRMNPELKIIGGVAAVVAIGLVWWATRDKPEEAAEPPAGNAPAALGPYTLSTPAHGPATAPAVLVKYTDFQ